MLKGLVVRQENEERKRRDEFAEREKKLWAVSLIVVCQL